MKKKYQGYSDLQNPISSKQNKTLAIISHIDACTYRCISCTAYLSYSKLRANQNVVFYVWVLQSNIVYYTTTHYWLKN